jgi:hypothetical protein
MTTSTAGLGPRRIVCLTEETTEWLYLLGKEARIVGISGYTVPPRRARDEVAAMMGRAEQGSARIAAMGARLVYFRRSRTTRCRHAMRFGYPAVTRNCTLKPWSPTSP